jgi:hypothetical protein
MSSCHAAYSSQSKPSRCCRPDSRYPACLLATIAIGGCASSANRTLDDPNTSSSTPRHGSLTDREINVAVAAVPTNGDDASVSAVLITADPESGKACLISVQSA